MNSSRTLGVGKAMLAALLAAWPAWVWPQSIVATLSVGDGPLAVAINHATHTLYVADILAGTVTVIDVTTDSTSTVKVGDAPIALGVNEATNKIYVANNGNFPAGAKGSISVIDGTTNSVTQIALSMPQGPGAVAVNSSTNKIYVANNAPGNVTVIDGATNSITNVSDPNASGLWALDIAVNPVTNKIYVANSDPYCQARGNVTVIDGTTNLTTTVTDPNAFAPIDIAVNQATDKIYVANMGNCSGRPNKGNVTVIDGATNVLTTVTDPHALNPGGIPGAGSAVAVDAMHNKIYVINEGSSNLTVIDGGTNVTTTVTPSNPAALIAAVANEATNTVYVVDGGCRFAGGCTSQGSHPGSITLIAGGSNTTKTVIDPKANGPAALAVDSINDRIYVANAISSNVTILDGAGTPTTHTLAVLLPGSGAGAVTSSPSGINCGASCAASFPSGAALSLGASANAGSEFSGWSGPCAGTGSCDLILNEDQFVTATFDALPMSAVPNVFGLTQAEATTAITRAGLVVGTVTQQPSSKLAAGEVVSESPAAGTNAPSGSAVDLVVSSGCSSCGGGASSGGGGALAWWDLGAMLLFGLSRSLSGGHRRLGLTAEFDIGTVPPWRRRCQGGARPGLESPSELRHEDSRP